MFHLLPTPIITTIFDCTNSFTTATRLSQCSKRLSEIWKSHLATLDLAHAFDSDPRWRSEKYRFFAVSIVRAQLEAAGKPSPATNDAIKAAYKIAGTINRVVSAIVADLSSESGDEAWARWHEYVIAKTLYMLWLAHLAGGAPCDPEYWVDSADMVGYLLQARWQELGFPDLAGLKEVRTPKEKAPVEEIGETCRKLAERVKRNREVMGLDLSDFGEEDDSMQLPDEFYDDSDLDDLSELDDEEFSMGYDELED